MLVIKFKPCCHECVNRKTYVNEERLNSDNAVILVITTIGCEHENVCKGYIVDYPESDK